MRVRPRKLLRAFQRAVGSFIKEVRRCALFVDMGLGKTVAVLTFLRDMCDDYEIGRVLIVGTTVCWPVQQHRMRLTKGATQITHRH